MCVTWCTHDLTDTLRVCPVMCREGCMLFLCSSVYFEEYLRRTESMLVRDKKVYYQGVHENGGLGVH